MLPRIAIAALFAFAGAPATAGSILVPTDSWIDQTFAAATDAPGWRRTFFSSADERAVGFARTLDGGYAIVMDLPASEIGLVRLDRDGQLVTAFGINGKLSLDPGFSSVIAMTVDAQDRIIVTGTLPGADSQVDIGVMRATPAGQFDATFSGDGIGRFGFDTDVAEYADVPVDVVAQADGRIVVAGNSEPLGSTNKFSIFRINVDGSLDATFGAIDNGAGGRRGSRDVFVDGQIAYSSALLEMAGGYFLVVGTTLLNENDSDFAARIITPQGSPWAGGAGSITLPIDVPAEDGTILDSAEAAARVDSRTALIVGHAGKHVAARRIRLGQPNQQGQYATLEIDTSFVGSAIPGKPYRFYSEDEYYVNDVAIRPDGSAMIAGLYLPFEGGFYGAVQRLRADGSADTSFDLDMGITAYASPVRTGGDSYFTEFVGVLIDDSRPVLLGTSSDNTSDATDLDIVTTRLRSARVVPPPTFRDGFESDEI